MYMSRVHINRLPRYTCVKVLSIWGCKKISLCCSSFHHSWGTMPDHTNLKPQHGRVDETTKRSMPVNHLCQRLPRCQIKVDKCCSRNLQEFTGYRGPRVFSWRTYKNRAEKRNLEGLLRLASVRVLRDPRRRSQVLLFKFPHFKYPCILYVYMYISVTYTGHRFNVMFPRFPKPQPNSSGCNK